MSDIRPASFIVWTFLGTAIFTLALAGAGYVLEARYERVARWLDPVTTTILVAGVTTYVWRLCTFPQPRQRRRR